MARHLWCYAVVVTLLSVAGLAEDCTIAVQPGESIQEAIDAASPGDVICLAEGEWEENLVIEKSLTLRAAEIEPEPLAVITSAREGWPVIRIESDEPIDVSIQGLKITGSFGRCYQREPEWICADGISVHGKATATIENSSISKNWHGIEMRGASHATIESNTISHNKYGIGMLASSQATITSNTISRNYLDGIEMWGSSHATIERNTISGNNLDGIRLGASAQAMVDNNAISGSFRFGIWMSGSSQATIEGNTISDNRWDGILMEGFSQATIIGNVIRDNERYGVALGERPCFIHIWPHRAFTGYVTGRENTGGGNAEGDYCPEALAFLFTEEGGELDRRDEE